MGLAPGHALKNTSTPHGNNVTYVWREDTSDGALISAIVEADEYDLKALHGLEGYAIDLGSHVGSVAIALAVDHPLLHVIAIEPVADNCRVIRETAERNGIQDRVTVLQAAGGSPGMTTARVAWDYQWAEGVDAEHVHQSRFIGGVFREPFNKNKAKFATVPVVNLPALAAEYGRFCFAKTDCEGGEWEFFAQGAGNVDLIVGEWHDRQWPAIADLLADTHDTQVLSDAGGIGLFRAVLR